jgi:hypothetical protein
MALSEKVSNYLLRQLFPHAIKEGISPTAAFQIFHDAGFTLNRQTYFQEFAKYVSTVALRDRLPKEPKHPAIAHSLHEIGGPAQVFNYIYVFTWESFDPLTDTWTEQGMGVSSAVRMSPDQAFAQMVANGYLANRNYDQAFWDSNRNIKIIRAARAPSAKNRKADIRSVEDILRGTPISTRGMLQ